MNNLRAFKLFFARVRNCPFEASRNGHFGQWLLKQSPSRDELEAGTEFLVHDQGSNGLFEVRVNFNGQIIIGRVFRTRKCGNFLFLDIHTTSPSRGFKELKFSFSQLEQACFESEKSTILCLVIRNNVQIHKPNKRKGFPDGTIAQTANCEPEIRP